MWKKGDKVLCKKTFYYDCSPKTATGVTKVIVCIFRLIFKIFPEKKDRLFIKGKYYTITEYPIFEGHYLFSSEWKSEIPVSKKSIDKYFYTEKGLRKLKLKRLKTLKFKS